MSGAAEMGLQLAVSAVRLAWFYGIHQLVDGEARRMGQRPSGRPKGPVPSERELLGSLTQLMLADAEAVRQGLSPIVDYSPLLLGRHMRRVRDMFSDLPKTLDRRSARDTSSVEQGSAATSALPDYYVQDFHFQTGGYLSAQSARLYDAQVETLFYGAALLMRRRALPYIARALRGRNQREASLLDVACGTGRLLRQVRLAWPALKLTGIDLSHAYLDEARRHLEPLRPARLIAGNAEALPVPDASQDIVCTVFLYHELPPAVRRVVTTEIARVLKPGGIVIFIDSLQFGDKPAWDGLLEAFPARLHEPYFSQYARDDLEAMFNAAGLGEECCELAFLSKVMVRRKREVSALPAPDRKGEA
jgi:ubiquinone/menaquinone biosynthesis C-methylase UbiE